MEELLEQGEWRGKEGDPPSTPLARAQALVYDAFEVPEEFWQRRIPLAKEALRISHNCADAHVLLAELDSPSDEQAQRRYLDAVKAAERALKDVDVASRPRDYWHLMKVRPLVRALAGAADVHYAQGEYEKALDVYRRLFEIDHLDVMEVRQFYIGVLIAEGHDEEIIRFLEQQERLDRMSEESAHIQYSHALARFRLEGDSEPARSAIRTAHDRNSVVPRYLLGVEKADAYAFFVPDTDVIVKDAVQYYMHDCYLWLRTPNAIEWLRAQVPGEMLESTSRRKR